MSSSVEDLKDPRFWRAAVGEALGTLILVLIGCGTCIGGDAEWEKSVPTTVQISLAFGLAVATVVWCLAHVRSVNVLLPFTFSSFNTLSYRQVSNPTILDS